MKKKEIKTWEIGDKYGYIVVGVFIAMFILFIYMFINILRVNSIEYTYYKEGKKGHSNECYQTELQDCYCLIDNNFVSVDEYHD